MSAEEACKLRRGDLVQARSYGRDKWTYAHVSQVIRTQPEPWIVVVPNNAPEEPWTMRAVDLQHVPQLVKTGGES